MGHGRRVYQSGALALVPGASVGLGLVRGGAGQDPAVLFASAGVGVMVGQGATRGVLMPTVSVSTGPEQVVSLGVSAGLVQSLGR